MVASLFRKRDKVDPGSYYRGITLLSTVGKDLIIMQEFERQSGNDGGEGRKHERTASRVLGRSVAA